MKYLLFCTTAMLLTMNAFCQQTKTFQPGTREYYQHKSANQKVGAWLLLGGGLAIVTITGIEAASNLNFFAPAKKHQYDVPLGIAAACVAASIPLFIASGNNKQKARYAAVSLKLEKAPSIRQAQKTYLSYPAVAVTISISNLKEPAHRYKRLHPLD